MDRTARTQVLRREYSVDRSAHAQAPPISNELARLSGRKDFIPLEEYARGERERWGGEDRGDKEHSRKQIMRRERERE